MKEIARIYNHFYDLNTDDSIGIIRLYEKNQIILDNKSTFTNKADFKDFTLFLAKYIISLETIGKYSKAVKYSEKLLNLIDLKSDEFEINKKDFTVYWSVLTTKGRSLYYLKNYKESIQTFEKLLEWDSENDNIKNWLNTSRSKKRAQVNRYLYITALILFFLSVLPYFKDSGMIFLKLGFLFSIIGLINEYFGDIIEAWLKK